MYEEGEDTTKAVYIAKLDDIRFITGPIVQRYREKAEAERQTVQKAREEEYAKKRADVEAKRKAEEEAKKAEAESKKQSDTEMKDASSAEGAPAPAEGEEKKQ